MTFPKTFDPVDFDRADEDDRAASGTYDEYEPVCRHCGGDVDVDTSTGYCLHCVWDVGR